MKAPQIIESIGAKSSLALGLPFGFVAMMLFAMVSVIITGESLFLFEWFFTNGYSTLGLLIAFIFILWFAGRMLARDIYANKTKLKSTSKYSVLVNIVIWSVFILVHVITNKELDAYFGLTFPLILAIISIVITPFTAGHWTYKSINSKIKKFAPSKVQD